MARRGKPSNPPRATPRVREHIDNLRQAGLDTEKFFDALIAIRDDSALPHDHREAVYKLIAMESFVWYLEAIRNERIDREKLREAVNEIATNYDAAIRKQGSGEKATELLSKDIGQDPPAGASKPRNPGGAPKPRSAGGAPKPRSAGGAPKPRSAGGAPKPRSAGGAPRSRAGGPRKAPSRAKPRKK